MKMETPPKFDIECDGAVTYEADARIIDLVQIVRAEHTDILNKLPVTYHRFIHLFSSPRASILTI